MAALVDGTRYGLSSQGNNNDNKTLIFVKLTDSALRAIDEYLNNRGNTSRKPTIQFHGNQGVLKFPSAHHSNEEHSFDFTFSPSSETESLQGSFECIQKCGSRSLESLGCMQYKMHIHAKDDVYQATKSRMAAAEEESKKNCTKVIKPAAPCIGRKVKVKKPLSHSLRPPPSSPPYLSSKPSNPMLIKPIANGHVNGVVASHHSNNQPKVHHNSKTYGNSEIMKRSYRERIIHLLALRPYKKPELLARLMKDGIKEKDKKSLTSILFQVAVMRDNSYQLAKHVWNEVQEDWPFYSEADRQLLKRRMPQNLSPSLGDCELSPGGNSMNSSPGSQKRQNNDHSTSAIPTKKQRISHYTKQHEPLSNGKPESAPAVSRSDNHNQFNGHHKKEVNGYVNGHSRSEMNGVVNGFKDVCRFDSGSSVSVKSDNYSVSSHHQHHHGVSNKFDSFSGQHVGKTDSTPLSSSYNSSYSKESKNDSSSTALNTINGYSSNHYYSNSSRHNGKLSSSSMLCNGSTGGSRHTTPSSSPESQDAIDIRGPSSQQSIGGSSPFSEPDSVDHLKKYTVITTPEQRAQYKADFNAEYDEYRHVYATVHSVSKRFVVFQERLRNCEDSAEESRKIKEQIIKAYQENKQNQEYQDAKKRFNYLHQKLSHIKKLIFQYDSAHMCDS